MSDIRGFANELGVSTKGKKKDELVSELKYYLPEEEQWASSEDNWESIRIPGLNGYGNVDVR